ASTSAASSGRMDAARASRSPSRSSRMPISSAPNVHLPGDAQHFEVERLALPQHGPSPEVEAAADVHLGESGKGAGGPVAVAHLPLPPLHKVIRVLAQP